MTSRPLLALVLVAAAWAMSLVARDAAADPIPILVAASSSQGGAADRPLAHAKEDAAAVRDALATLGGVGAANAIVVSDASRGSLLAALGRAQAIARSRRADEVTFFFYFSGHGDRDALHLGAESLPIAELSSAIAAVPAALRVVVVDACRTTDGRAKGMSSEPAFAVSLTTDAATTGTAWLFASSDGEAALESDEIGGAIFTHFWIAGLRGAADVLYLVYAKRSQSVVAEVYGAADRNVRLALPAGRYVVQRRAGTRGSAAEIDVGEGQRRALEPSDFRAFPPEALALKGAMVVRPWSALAQGFAFGGAGVGVGGEVAIAVGVRGDAWGIAVGPLASTTDTTTPANEVSERAVGGELAIDRFVALGQAWSLRVGVDARGEWVWQRVTRNDAARVTAVGLNATTRYTGALFGGGAHVAARLFLRPSVFVDVGVKGLALGAKTTDGAEGRVLGGGTLGVGATF